MKRDMELIRLLLHAQEDEGHQPDLKGYSKGQILYHYELMEEAGLLVAQFSRDINGEVCEARIRRLTNLGHDFLDACRSDTVWRKFKQTVGNLGGAITIPVAVELLKKLVRTELGL